MRKKLKKTNYSKVDNDWFTDGTMILSFVILMGFGLMLTLKLIN